MGFLGLELGELMGRDSSWGTLLLLIFRLEINDGLEPFGLFLLHIRMPHPAVLSVGLMEPSV